MSETEKEKEENSCQENSSTGNYEECQKKLSKDKKFFQDSTDEDMDYDGKERTPSGNIITQKASDIRAFFSPKAQERPLNEQTVGVQGCVQLSGNAKSVNHGDMHGGAKHDKGEGHGSASLNVNTQAEKEKQQFAKKMKAKARQKRKRMSGGNQPQGAKKQKRQRNE